VDALNTRCIVTKVVAADVHGQPVLGESRDERCAVLKLFGNDRSVTDGIRNTPDYPTSSDPGADVVFLLHITTTANVADMIRVEGLKLEVIGISASYDGVGKLSHYVIEAMRWK
jgi:hypothetical protein